MAAAIRTILIALGEDPDREGLAGTPDRVARMYAEVFSGLRQKGNEAVETFFEEEDHHELVMVKDIPFYSMCEHHLLPFHGRAHVAYLPRGTVTGLSKLARLVDVYARRPQMQERLTTQIANTLMEALNPYGVLVVMEAEHLCMSMRGIKKPGSITVTSAVRGSFCDDPATRSEAMALLFGRR
ncbi:MAG: GTP cyclohydrolase I FolE [Acidimicrobiia bacterium]|nr:GTP cyclohydrolase I FolE [Acidimicrobiia bacterium]